jgi:uncharacterized protein (TIGR00156 family)
MNNKIFCTLALIGGLFFCGNTNAADATKQVSKPVTHVADASNMAEDTIIYVQGNLTQNLGDEMYIFTDDSGNITVEIDDDLMQGKTFTPNMAVIITASIDKEGNVTSLDAEEIEFMDTNSMNMSNNMN